MRELTRTEATDERDSFAVHQFTGPTTFAFVDLADLDDGSFSTAAASLIVDR